MWNVPKIFKKSYMVKKGEIHSSLELVAKDFLFMNVILMHMHHGLQEVLQIHVKPHHDQHLSKYNGLEIGSFDVNLGNTLLI